MKNSILYIAIAISLLTISCNKDKDPIVATPQSTTTEYKFYKVSGFGNSLKDTVTLYSASQMYNPWLGQCLIDPRFTLNGVYDSVNLRYDYEIITAPSSQKILGVWHFGASGYDIGNTVFISCQLYSISAGIQQYIHTSSYSRVQ
jgi:hypothetical protein